MEFRARTGRRGIFSLSCNRFILILFNSSRNRVYPDCQTIKLFLQWPHTTFVNARKPGVDFGHDNDPLSGVRQELRGLVPHRRLRAVPRITAVFMFEFQMSQNQNQIDD